MAARARPLSRPHPHRHRRAAPAAALLLSGIVFLCLPCSAAAQEAAAPATKRWSDATDRVSIALPADWERVTVQQGSMEKLDEAVIHVRVRAPGWDGPLTVWVAAWTGVSLTLPACIRGAHKRLSAEKPKHHTLECVDQPVPHFVKDSGISAVHLTTFWFARMRGHGFSVELDCARTDLPRLRAVLPAITATLHYDGPVWPPRVTEGRTETQVDGFVILHRDVPPDAVKWVKERVREVQRDFVDVHGPITRPEGEAPVIYLHATLDQHAEIEPVRPKEPTASRLATEWWRAKRHILTVPPNHRGLQERTQFVEALVSLMLCERYGDPAPTWFEEGEYMLAAYRHEAGRELPAVPQRLHDLLRGFRRPLADMPNIRRLAGSTFHDDYVAHAVGYVTLFHAGKRKWRDAYRAFLAELARTADGEAAAKAHLYSLDQDELRKDAKAWVQKLRPWPPSGK